MRCRTLLLVCFLFNIHSTMRGQSPNPCGVVAVLSPSGDSIVTSPTAVYFQSASINATSYKIIIDVYDLGMNAPINLGIQPGLTKVILVAYNGSCTDTAIAYYFYAGQYPSVSDNPRNLYGYANRDQSMTGFLNVGAGGYIISGHRDASNFFNEQQQGLIIKTKQAGCVGWAKKIGGKFSSDVTHVKESTDGGFFIASELDGKNAIAKFDLTGNVQWSKEIVATDGNDLAPIGLEALPGGGVAVAGIYNYVKLAIARLDNSGAIVWQHEYDYNAGYTGQFANLLYKNNALYVGGNLNYNNFTNYDPFLTKIDFASGQTIWMKKYLSATGGLVFRNMLDVDSTIVINIAGATGTNNIPVIGGFMRLDTSGQVLGAKLIAENYIPNTLVGPYGAGGMQLIRSGKTFYMISSGSELLSLQPGITFLFKIAKIDSSYNVEWVESNGGVVVPIFNFDAPAPVDGLAIGGTEGGSGFSPNSLGSMFSLKHIDSSGGNPSASCFFGKQDFVIVPLTISVQPDNWTIDVAGSSLSSSFSLPIANFFPEMRIKCPDFVDSCSILKITGPAAVCNLGDVYTYNSHKNKSCGQPTIWNIPPGVQVISQQDRSISVRFPEFGRYVIYGTNPLNCVPVQDSIVVIAASKTPPLDLGPDQQICPQNTKTLHSGPYFFSYKWQDGSTDSLLKINAPGQYWVMVTDSCDNILRDTINISLAPPIPISIGPDRVKCNNDTIQLHAPQGFMNYSWSPSYNIDAANSQNVTVNPQTDTSYTIIAEASPGCFAYDTVRINVFHSPPINLGADKSFCQDDSAIFDAGIGFSSYKWNSGASTQKLVAHAAGEYSVVGITSDGCLSQDTVKVLKTFPLPVLNIDQNPVICAGTPRVLDAGNGFSTYLWNDGSQSSSITISSPGNYSVEVTDGNGCIGNASVLINSVQPLPTGFLPPDTAICSYGTVTLAPSQLFNTYLWSTGGRTSTIIISQPGIYTLQVADNQNCIGKDTITVNPKDCMIGLFVPNAFTPNQDGKNDQFRPLLFGNIKYYHFSVYNRWGNIVFQSDIPGKGWDGKYGGILQSDAVFIWTCSYQVEGEVPKFEKGTTVLIR